MSLKQNDIYEEYMYENNVCTICQNVIYISSENREDQMGQGYEYNLEDGHSEECDLFRVEADPEAKERRLAYTKKKIIMPVHIEKPKSQWEKDEDEKYRFKMYK